MRKTHIILLAVLCAGLSSCASYVPSAEYQKCKASLVETISQDLKEGAE